MSDIFFKCGACAKPLVADDTGAGLTINCPDCQTAIAIPKVLLIHECPHCKQKIKAAAEMKGESVTCPSCQQDFAIPGQPVPQPGSEILVALICPKCQAEIEATEEAVHQLTPCPNCGEHVHFRRKLRIKETTDGIPMMPAARERRKMLYLAITVALALLILLVFFKIRGTF